MFNVRYSPNWMFTAHFLSSGMQEKTTEQDIEPKWIKEYTISAVLGVLFILLFWLFTSTFNLP
ncbi:hypothetical protein SAMN06265219_11624 [Gracilimonas mengyeensis]|uniref:Uncharacterized protein n=1 Tax=Gracilimonas mengyeensis TaxID=1302730 RepID=A0A521FB34_9BACT|nr:hypothetical protein SAMN06265219_11624 [Gracilimonas mengyeensis]